MTTGHSQQTHRAHAPSPGHFHSHDLHNLHHRRGAPGLERASGGFRGVHQNFGKIGVFEFAIWCSLEACKRPLADIQLGLPLQLRGNAREHLHGNIVPRNAREAPLEHILHPFLVCLRDRGVPPIEQVEFDRIGIALPSIDERMVRLADGTEWVKRPRVEVGDEAEDSSDIVTEDSRSEMPTVNQTRHIEYVVVLLVFLLRCKRLPFYRVVRVDTGPTLVDLENLLAVN